MKLQIKIPEYAEPITIDTDELPEANYRLALETGLAHMLSEYVNKVSSTIVVQAVASLKVTPGEAEIMS